MGRPIVQWTDKGIAVLPHIGGLPLARRALPAKLFLDNVARFLDDRPLRAVVDQARGARLRSGTARMREPEHLDCGPASAR
jgi:hypothetical protein